MAPESRKPDHAVERFPTSSQSGRTSQRRAIHARIPPLAKLIVVAPTSVVLDDDKEWRPRTVILAIERVERSVAVAAHEQHRQTLGPVRFVQSLVAIQYDEQPERLY